MSAHDILSQDEIDALLYGVDGADIERDFIYATAAENAPSSGITDLLQSPRSNHPWKNREHLNPSRAQLLHLHLSMGIEVELAKTIIAQTRNNEDLETTWRHSLDILAKQIEVQYDNFIDTGGVCALLGSTGVGKTTTVAKIATRCALKYGSKSVGLITTECLRVDGQERLRSYAQILDVPVHVAKTHQQLANALSQLADRRFILIDTAGINQRDSQLTEKLSIFKNQSPLIKHYLALSATTQTNRLNDIITAFSQLELAGCILTKTDETHSLGGAISAMIGHQLPLAYRCHGQHVFEDFSLPDPATLVKDASLLMNEQQLDPQTLSSYGKFAAYG